jgi:hypothetical protein
MGVWSLFCAQGDLPLLFHAPQGMDHIITGTGYRVPSRSKLNLLSDYILGPPIRNRMDADRADLHVTTEIYCWGRYNFI